MQAYHMRSIANLFGRSPFVPLRQHMEKVANAVRLLRNLFDALFTQNHEQLKTFAEQIQAYEHEADRSKNDIRNHLPKSLFLPIDRVQLLEILTLQDRLADRAEDVAVLCTLKNLSLSPSLHQHFQNFLTKNLETFEILLNILTEMHELLETSFGGYEAERISGMVEQVAYHEHEADVSQHQLMHALLQEENQFTPGSFYLWMKITESLSDIANISEKLANRVRMTLEPA
jgi:predicted phosphate transport protein (TIGR00153 family)